MRLIDDCDKNAITDYVNKLNEDQDSINVKIIFKICSVDDSEYVTFKFRAKTKMYYSIQEAVAFLDGVYAGTE